MLILDEDGEKAVKLARTVVEDHLDFLASSGSNLDGNANNHYDNIELNRDAKSYGVFVTLNYIDKHKQEHLRGCVGFPRAEKSLYLSVIDASIGGQHRTPDSPQSTKRNLQR